MKTAGLAWMFFVITGVFVSLVVPLGEGFDEPWHFAYIQYVAETGKLPPGPHLHLSVELDEFLRRQPMGWRLRDIFPSLQTQEDYWAQSDSKRAAADLGLRDLHFSGSYIESSTPYTAQYESHQAPLYYVIGALPFRLLARFLSFSDTFLFIRIGSVLVASVVVPLAYLLAKRVSSFPDAPEAVAVLVATFPGIYPDLARVSNDALLVPLAGAALLALTRFFDSRSNLDAVVLGLILLAGLSTKALFVPIVLAVMAALLAVKEFRAAATTAIISAAGWIWYLRNAWITGSITGLPETVSTNSTVASSIHSFATIRWPEVVKLAAVSHIWMGYWSLLQYRSWIYETIMMLFGIGLVGFAIYFWHSHSAALIALSAIYGAYWIALIYYATQVVQQTGVPVIQGWYLSPLVAIEALMFVLGVGFCFPRRHSWIIAGVACCFVAMIVYGNAFIAAPYYSGIIRHAPSGSLRAYHPRWADVFVISSRLTRFHPWIPSALPLMLGLMVVFTGFFLIWTYYDVLRRSEPSHY